MKPNRKKMTCLFLTCLCLFSLLTAISPLVSTLYPSLQVTLQTELPFYAQGELVKIFGNVTDPYATPVQGASVALEVRDPNSNTVFLDITTSQNNGSFYDSFRLSLAAPSGQYTVYAVASKIGYTSGSNQTFFTVGSSTGTAFAVWTQKSSYLRFENTTIYGRLFYNRTAVQDATITFNLIFPNQTLWLILSNTTVSNGIATHGFYLPPTIPAGQYRVNASSYKPGIPNGTATTTFTILNQEPKIHSASINPQIIEKPDTTNIQANISDFEDLLNLTALCIITFPNSTVQILNMSSVNGLFKLQYQIPYTYPLGTYLVTIRAVDHDAGSADYRTSFEVITPILKGAAQGWVLTNTGQAIPNATITLSLRTAYLTYSTTTNTEGAYNLTRIMPGQYNLIASASEYAEETIGIEIIADQTTYQNVTLSHLPILKGTVTTQLGQPITNALVQVKGSQGLAAQGSTYANGSYRLVIFSTGIFTATASATGYSPNSTSITCSLDQTTYTNFSLIKNGDLIGTVIDAISLDPITNATVMLSKNQFIETQKTNSTGHFVYGDVYSGTYTLTATASGYLSNRTTVNIYSNQTTTQQITLTPTGNVTGAVTEAVYNNPIQGAIVTLMDYRGVTLAAVLTNSNGSYLFYQVKPASYTVKVCAYGYNTTSAVVDVVPHAVTTANFTLVPNVVFLTLESSSAQYSRGETAQFTINATNMQGQSIADNVTIITLTMKGLNNETRELSCTRDGDHFVASYSIPYNETIGTWTVTATVSDIFGNYAEDVIQLGILEAFWIQFFTDKSSYVIGECVNFTAYVLRYSNLSRFLNSTEVSASVDVRNPQNTTIATLSLTTSGNALVGNLDTTDLAKVIYTAYLNVSDLSGNSRIVSIIFAVVEDFHVTLNTNKDFYNRTETVHIYGSVAFSNGTAAANTSVLITVLVKNYPRTFYVATNSSGNFEYDFTPLGIDAGNYTATCTSKIEGIERQATKAFVILGLALSPSYLKVGMSENSANDFTIKILNTGETILTGISVNIQPSTIDGVTISIVSPPQVTIAPGGWTSFTIRVSATEGAATQTKFNLMIHSDQNAVELGYVEVNLYPATPVLQVAPQLIDISMAPTSYSTHTITTKNIGYKTLKNATIQPPSNSWITATTDYLGDLNPQEVKLFDIIIHPSNSTPIGLYQDKIVIVSQNHTPVNIYIIVKITSAQNGTLLFKVIDDNGSVVPNARIILQYQEYWLEAQTKLTNSTGHCEFPSLRGGRYSYVVSAENHDTVSGTTTVQPASTVYVEVISPLKAMEVTFNVVPITIEDEYYIVLNITFETDIPKPTLVPIPPMLTFAADRAKVFEQGYDSTMGFNLYNTGLISIFNVTISVDTPLPPGYTISLESFGDDMYLGEITAESTVQIPCRLTIESNRSINELENGIVGKIKIEGYYVYFDQNQNAKRARVNAEVLVRIADKGARRLCVNPPAIYGVNLGGVISFTPGAWPERLDDVTITNCASEESVYLYTIAVGGGITLFMGLDLMEILTNPFSPFDLGGFVAFGLITRYGGIPGEGITLVEAEDTFGMVDVEVFGGPLMSLLVQALVRQVLGEGTIGSLELQPTESAILSSEMWDIPTSFADLFEDLIGVRIRYGVEITIGGIVFAYQWELDTGLSFHLVPIFIVDFYTPYISIPVSAGPVSGSTVPWSSWWGYSGCIISPPTVTPVSQPTIPTIPPPPTETVHEIVKLSISQEATLERDAFLATLQMTNKMQSTEIDYVHVVLDITFINGTDAGNNFYVSISDLQNISGVDGTGTIQPGATAAVSWLIIPKPGAGGTSQAGIYYRICAQIDYFVNQTIFHLSSSNETINVRPQPLLILDYYLPEEVNANQPFKLGIRVTNIGYGTAGNFKIDSAQPVIYDNQAGLLITFSLIGCYVRGQAFPHSLRICFGDIRPGESVIGYWVMVSSLSGVFTEFNATFTHSNALGGEATSLIQAVNAHILMRDIMMNETDFAFLIDSDNDTVPDQIVDPSLGATATVVPAEYSITHQNQTTITITAHKYVEGWIWINLSDPFNNQKEIFRIQRSDGKILDKQNYWMADGKIYIVDDPEESYTILFDANAPLITGVFQTPATPDYNDEAAVTATITDDVAVDDALLSYTYNAIWYNVTMNRVDDTFSASIPAQPHGTLVQYLIYSNDTSGNWAMSELYSYSVGDFSAPSVVLFHEPTYPLPAQVVKVYANVTEPLDASGVKTVYFFYGVNGQPWWNTTMMFDSELGLYKSQIPAYDKGDIVDYFAKAVDNAGNENVTATQSYIVLVTDINQDTIVDVKDVFLIAKAYGSSVGEPNYNLEADINKDGVVGIQDLEIALQQFGEDPPAPTLETETDLRGALLSGLFGMVLSNSVLFMMIILGIMILVGVVVVVVRKARMKRSQTVAK